MAMDRMEMDKVIMGKGFLITDIPKAGSSTTMLGGSCNNSQRFITPLLGTRRLQLDSGLWRLHHVTGDLTNLSTNSLMKDLKTGARLTQGRSKDDVYEWPWPNKGNTLGLAMLHKASLPLKYWSYAFLAAAYLINRLPTPILKHQSPFESLFQHMPNYDKLRAFGCLCFPWMRPYSDHKLDKRSKPCVFLGYSNTHNAYKCLDLSSNRVYISRHVQFIEHKFPFASNTTPTDLDQAISTWSSCSPALAAIQPSFFVVPTSSKSFPHQAPSYTNTGPNQELISSLSLTSSSPPTTASAPLSACDAPPTYDLSLSSLLCLLTPLIFHLHLCPCHHLPNHKGPILYLSHFIAL
ncbi:Retrovirus-related Pol polyprotein from transposon RE1 [Vitis vinifera]|uniref:Retrovirus-related Pol polyprotein from transposon RE1 n=1 Tax=Vitis vinifera TaxID=29760 RepID=A0A438D7Y5_VITVI|nr:Retrovirus-related Pol polyprotein from transposon RE1 [Vitis vinifera]